MNLNNKEMKKRKVSIDSNVIFDLCMRKEEMNLIYYFEVDG